MKPLPCSLYDKRISVSAYQTVCSMCGREDRRCVVCAEKGCINQPLSMMLWYCWSCIDDHHLFHELAEDPTTSRIQDHAWAREEAAYAASNRTK